MYELRVLRRVQFNERARIHRDRFDSFGQQIARVMRSF